MNETGVGKTLPTSLNGEQNYFNFKLTRHTHAVLY